MFIKGPSSLVLSISFVSSVLCAITAISPSKPLSIPSSEFWDGDDGPWSTFRIGVGTSTQQIRVLPAIDQSSSWLVIPEACTHYNVSSTATCDDQRGGLYWRNKSSTWNAFGEYKLNTYVEKRAGLDGDGLYGYDTVSLGWPGDGLPTLINQSIAGIITPNFTIGTLALSPHPINFTDYNNPIPSLLQNLRKGNTTIPSLSWSYTAGSYNSAPRTLGSLVLGGYDSTRFNPNNVTFPFGRDMSLEFQVAIQRISSNVSTAELLDKPIISYISSLIPDMWLPAAACTAIQKAFHLYYDNTTNTYYANSSMHAQNKDKNPVVTLQMGPEVAGQSITINLPYWNFYHLDGFTLIDDVANNQNVRVPIKRTANDSLYILGRSFLQSAHLSADYERNIFNLSQALYPSSATKQNIVAVLPVVEYSGGSGKLSGGAIAGIAIATVTVVAIVATILFWLYRQKRKITKQPERHELNDTDTQEMIKHEVSGNDLRHEVGEGLNHEMPGDMKPRIELPTGAEQEKPVEIAQSVTEIFELPATEKNYVELEGEGHLKELG